VPWQGAGTGERPLQVGARVHWIAEPAWCSPGGAPGGSGPKGGGGLVGCGPRVKGGDP
jgi:hypothetical protein